MNQRESMKTLIERSSLGTSGAAKLRARTSSEAVRRVLERVQQRKAAASNQSSPASSLPALSHSGTLLRRAEGLIDVAEPLPRRSPLVLVGTAGSGKSALLRRLPATDLIDAVGPLHLAVMGTAGSGKSALLRRVLADRTIPDILHVACHGQLADFGADSDLRISFVAFSDWSGPNVLQHRRDTDLLEVFEQQPIGWRHRHTACLVFLNACDTGRPQKIGDADIYATGDLNVTVGLSTAGPALNAAGQYLQRMTDLRVVLETGVADPGFVAALDDPLSSELPWWDDVAFAGNVGAGSWAHSPQKRATKWYRGVLEACWQGAPLQRMAEVERFTVAIEPISNSLDRVADVYEHQAMVLIDERADERVARTIVLVLLGNGDDELEVSGDVSPIRAEQWLTIERIHAGAGFTEEFEGLTRLAPEALHTIMARRQLAGDSSAIRRFVVVDTSAVAAERRLELLQHQHGSDAKGEQSTAAEATKR
jgi:CHAT domain